MNKISESFDPNVVEWRNYKDLECEEYNINFDYSILGYDIEKGKLDMMLRYKKGRGGCRRHRHIAATTTIVIEGEQHLTELRSDGSKKEIRRKKGDYAVAPPDALPHLEHGGDNGGIVMLSLHSEDGRLIEYFDKNYENSWVVTVEDIVNSWKANEVYGAAPNNG